MEEANSSASSHWHTMHEVVESSTRLAQEVLSKERHHQHCHWHRQTGRWNRWITFYKKRQQQQRLVCLYTGHKWSKECSENTNTRNSHALQHFNTKDTSCALQRSRSTFWTPLKQTKIENTKHIFARKQNILPQTMIRLGQETDTH